MAYFTTKQTPSFAPVSMGGPLDFLTNLLTGGGAAAPDGSSDGGDPSVSGENPEWWNKLSAAQKPYFSKNGAQKAAILDTAVGCPKVGPDGTTWVRNQYGWCGPVKKAEPGLLENAFSAFSNLFGGGKKPSPTPGPAPAQTALTKPPAGMSTGTKIAIGVGAVGLVAAVVVLTKKKQQ
jgi:hypothetical protein